LVIWGSILVAILAFMMAFFYIRLFGVIKSVPQVKLQAVPEILTSSRHDKEFDGSSGANFDQPSSDPSKPLIPATNTLQNGQGL
jgi:hypothetical protein